MRRLLLAIPAVLCACAPEPVPPPDPEPEPELARGVDLERVALYQAVQVDLLTGGVAPDAETPVVAGRAALLRAFVAPHEGWRERDLRAELILRAPDGTERRDADVLRIDGPSRPEDRDTAFEFALAAEDVVPGASWRVELWETGAAPAGAEPGMPTWPSEPDTTQPLRVTDWGGVVRVELVPIRYDADGSGRLPALDEGQLAVHRSWLERLFPVHRVELTVGEEWPVETAIRSDGEGWGDVLEALSELRVERGIPWDTYAYGIFAPAEDRDVYCRTGCTAGLSYRVENPNSDWLRVSIGLGYPGDDDGRVLVHEVAHAHGRRHAPCGPVTGADPDYPNATGHIGAWGWDPLEDRLIPPTVGTDVMGYCDDKWISPYQFEGLHRRVAMFEGIRQTRRAPAETEVLVLRVDGDGDATLRGRRVLPDEPSGEPVPLRWLLLDGSSLDGSGALARFGDLPGGTLFAAPPAGATHLLVGRGAPIPLEAP